MAYTFLFDQLTIGDYIGIQACVTASNVPALLTIIDRLTVGGVAQLPLQELNTVLGTFTTAYIAHMQSLTITDNPAVARLLHSALGDKD